MSDHDDKRLDSQNSGNQDDANEKRVEAALHQAAQTKPDAKAKAAALSAAMQAFDQAQGAESAADAPLEARLDARLEGKEAFISPVRQGFFQRVRQRSNNHNSGRRAMKNHTAKNNVTNPYQTNRWLYSGVAAASVLVISVVVSQQYPGQLDITAPKTELAERDDAVVLADRGLVDKAPSPQEKPSRRLEQEMASSAAPTPAKSEAYSAPALERRMAEEVAQHESKRLRALSKMSADSMVSGYNLPASAPVNASEVIANPGHKDVGRDDFEHVEDNPVKRVADDPVSTFSADVDTASYSFVRRQLNQGVLPQKDAVRSEEMLNYFDYAYPLPSSKAVPFATHVVVSDSPWKAGNKLMHIGIKGYDIAATEKPNTNLVFLLDVSGSMNSPDKLPLVKQSLELLLSQLDENDSVAIAVYAGAAGTVLAPTPANQKQKIMNALNQLSAGGSTAGGEGIALAYQLASAHFAKDAVNRVVLATDGDFNVGITDRDELKGFVEREREKGIYLSVLGFGQGNYHDHLMQELAQNGNGVAAYIDTLSEAQKVLVTEATSSLFPIAQDVKIQVEFNPETVAEYRLIGYETRALAQEDFNNDAVDAGDIGSGHTVTAIYEFTPVGGQTLIDPSRYAKASGAEDAQSDEYAFVKLRYKLPGESQSKLIDQPVPARNTVNAKSKVAPWVIRETQFATAVAGFSQLLRGGKYTGDWHYDDALALAQANKGEDLYGYRTELVQLIRKAKVAKGM
jgi:Ca-activated chloride channel homolog